MSTLTTPSGGIDERTRALLERLHRAFPRPFSPREAAETLGLSADRSRGLLAHLARQGWLSRVRHGLYTTVPLGASSPGKWLEDPWLVAHAAFSPCYVGGWSAAEHWHLTEQIFRDLVVVTAAAIRERVEVIQDTRFRLRFLAAEKHFGTRKVWRDQTPVLVSDPTRTLVDMLDEPWSGGGIRHVADVMTSYFESEHADETLLVEYASRLGNRTVFKRLGYLIETLQLPFPALMGECRTRMSRGLSKLDPEIQSAGNIRKRWNLRVNARVGHGDRR